MILKKLANSQVHISNGGIYTLCTPCSALFSVNANCFTHLTHNNEHGERLSESRRVRSR